MSRRWVADSSPIILLAKAGHLGLLSVPARDLLVPEVVAEEIREGPPTDPAREWLEEVGERFTEATSPVEPDNSVIEAVEKCLVSRVLTSTSPRLTERRRSRRTELEFTSNMRLFELPSPSFRTFSYILQHTVIEVFTDPKSGLLLQSL
jgi:hypothetical protein